MEKETQDIAESIHNTSTLMRDLAIIVGVFIGVLTFFVSRPEFSALASRHDTAEKNTLVILKRILTTQCKFARVNDKLDKADVDKVCKQL